MIKMWYNNFEWLEKPLLKDQTSDDKYWKKPTTVFKGFLIIYFWSFWSSLDNWEEISDGDKPNPKNLTHKINCVRVLDSIFSPYKSQTSELWEPVNICLALGTHEVE